MSPGAAIGARFTSLCKRGVHSSATVANLDGALTELKTGRRPPNEDLVFSSEA
jgi:hypothetical protein